MKNILNCDAYLKLIGNSCDYENLLRMQKNLATLVDRDKSSLTNFLAVTEQLDLLLKYDILQLIGVEFSADDDQKTVAQAKKEAEIQQEVTEKTNTYYSIVNDWDGIIKNAKTINQLLILCSQHKDNIDYETLKASHRIQQFMTIADMTAFKDDFLSRLKSDLVSKGVNFDVFLSQLAPVQNTSQADIVRLQSELENERAKLAEAEKAKQAEEIREAKQAKLDEENRKKLELEAKLKAQLEQESLKKAEELRIAQLKLEEEQRKLAEAEQKIKEAEALRQAQKDRNKQHIPLDIDKSSIVLKCPKCGKEYPSHYTICLKDGTKLATIHKNFSI